MVHYSKVAQGLALYVDREIVPKMAGKWQSWLIGGMAGIAAKKIEKGFPHIAAHPVVKMLGVIEGEGVDVGTIFGVLMEQARKGSVTVDLPMGVSLTMGPEDVNALHHYIMD